jgi:hypothetical protein
VASWPGAALEAIEEPSLYLASHGADPRPNAYRFLWLRTFHEPVAVRLALAQDESGTLVLKVTDGQGGYGPGDLQVHRQEAVTPEELADILDRLERTGFWHLPTRSATARIGMDGARWIVEGAREGRYHVVDHWSPGEGDLFREAALALVRLAKVPLDLDDVY